MPTIVTSSIKTGGSYTTITAWETAAPADLVAVDQVWKGECGNQAFDEDVVLSGSTADATRYKWLTVEAGAENLGQATIYHATDPRRGARIVRTGTRSAGVPIIQVDEVYAVVEGLAITFEGTAAGSGVSAVISMTKSNTKVVRNHIFACTLAPTTYGIVCDANFTGIVIANNIVHHITGATAARGIYVKGGFGAGPRNYTVTNNTVGACSQYGIYSEGGTAGVVTVQGNLSLGNTVTDFQWDNMSGQTADYNASGDATADDFGGSNSLINRVAADQVRSLFWATPISSLPTYNLKLRAGSSCIGASIDLGTSTYLATDINGRNRDVQGDNWDIGAHQYVSPGTTIKTVKSSGGDYTTISAAIAAVPADLDRQGVRWVINIDAGTYPERIHIQDGTLYADYEHFLTVQAALGAEHFGVPGTGVVIAPDEADVPVSEDPTHWGAPYTIIQWLEVTYVGTFDHAGGSSAGFKTNSHFVEAHWCLAHDIDRSARNAGFGFNLAVGSLIANCVAWNIEGGADEVIGIKMDPGGAVGYPSRILNCTVYHIAQNSAGASGWGILNGSTASQPVEVRNTIAMDTRTLDFKWFTGVGSVQSNNLSEDASADDQGGTGHVTLASPAAVFAQLSPFRPFLRASGSPANPAIGAALDLGGGKIAIDLKKYNRDSNSVTWDMGAHQYVIGVFPFKRLPVRLRR